MINKNKYLKYTAITAGSVIGLVGLLVGCKKPIADTANTIAQAFSQLTKTEEAIQQCGQISVAGAVGLVGSFGAEAVYTNGCLSGYKITYIQANDTNIPVFSLSAVTTYLVPNKVLVSQTDVSLSQFTCTGSLCTYTVPVDKNTYAVDGECDLPIVADASVSMSPDMGSPLFSPQSRSVNSCTGNSQVSTFGCDFLDDYLLLVSGVVCNYHCRELLPSGQCGADNGLQGPAAKAFGRASLATAEQIVQNLTGGGPPMIITTTAQEAAFSSQITAAAVSFANAGTNGRCAP